MLWGKVLGRLTVCTVISDWWWHLKVVAVGCHRGWAVFNNIKQWCTTYGPRACQWPAWLATVLFFKLARLMFQAHIFCKFLAASNGSIPVHYKVRYFRWFWIIRHTESCCQMRFSSSKYTKMRLRLGLVKCVCRYQSTMLLDEELWLRCVCVDTGVERAGWIDSRDWEREGGGSREEEEEVMALLNA